MQPPLTDCDLKKQEILDINDIIREQKTNSSLSANCNVPRGLDTELKK